MNHEWCNLKPEFPADLRSRNTFYVSRSALQWITVAVIATLLTACGSAPKRGSTDRPPGSSGSSSSGGGYYLDDGPGTNAPANIDAIPDAVPKIEPLGRGTMRPYTVMGRDYTPMTRLTPYKARGIASWYGKRYHGKQTSSGETYDMYGMTAAHTVLPIPSYVRVTSLANGRSVILRVNDRGPFIDSRLIDLSYSAAYKLGIIGAGRGMVEVKSIIPGVTPAEEPPPPVASAPPPAPVTTESPSAIASTLPSSPPPVPVAPASVATTLPATAAAASGSYLQFGAFGVQANAESYLSRLQSHAGWLSGALRIHHSDGIYRVQAGPYANEYAAREAAERAQQLLGMKPVFVIR